MTLSMLDHETILDLRRAIVGARLSDSRTALLAGIPAAFVASLPIARNPGEQVLLDLDVLNQAGILADFSVPLATWLKNSIELAGLRKEAEVLRAAMLHIVRRTRPDSGTKSPAPDRPQGGGPTERKKSRSTEPDSILREVWDLLDADLQDALSLAFNSCQRQGSSRISTKAFLAALQRLRPEPLAVLFERLPTGALPGPVPDDVPDDRSVAASTAPVSSCIADSLQFLTHMSSPDYRVSAPAIFVDVVRYGTGSSVRRLREHGIGPNEINELARGAGLVVAERTGGTD